VTAFRFLVPDVSRVPPSAVQRAYVAGIETIPWRSHNRLVGDELVLEREVDDSGNIFVPWQVPGRGEVVLSTASLAVREEPYNLPVELARGTLNRLRNQMAVWEGLGLSISAEVRAATREATQRHVRAVTKQNEPELSAAIADEAICRAMDAIFLLNADYTRQALRIRHENAAKLSTLLGVNLENGTPGAGPAKALCSAINTAVVPVNWRAVEESSGKHRWGITDQQLRWCHKYRVKVCAGPLIQLNRSSVPDWLYLWEDDFDHLLSCAEGYVSAVVNRYRGKVNLWHASGGLNYGDAMSFSEEQRLRLLVLSVETVRRLDPKTPVVVSFDCPWAEYLRSEAFDLSPLHFADALVRADLGLSGIGLDINLGYWPRGTLARDPLEFSFQLDRWSMLGLPLLVTLTAPSEHHEDPHARKNIQVVANGDGKTPSPSSQAKTIEWLVPLLLSKQSVQAIAWNQLYDGSPHIYPHGGLFDAQGHAKPVLDSLAEIFEEHLQ
jgi:hypothetical protein